MNAVCTLDALQLYNKVTKLEIPFFKWSSWIEETINKEFLRVVLRRPSRIKTGLTFLHNQDGDKKPSD